MKISNSILFIGLLVATGVLFFIFMFKPYMKDIREIKKDILDNQLRSNRESFIVQVLNEKSKNVEKLKSDIEALKKGLLSVEDQKEQNMFMNDIRATINRFDLQVDSSLEKGTENRDPFEVTMIELRLKGDFYSLYNFLIALEELAYTVEVESLDFRGIERIDDKMSARMILSAPLVGHL